MGSTNYGIKTEINRIAELEGKTVKDALPLLGNNIKIGTTNGGGFFFCGQTSDFVNNLEDIERTRRTRLKNARKAAEMSVGAMCKSPKAEVSDYLMELLNTTESIEHITPTYEGYVNFVQKRLHAVQKKSRNVTKKRLQAEAYEVLEKKTVVQAYLSITEPDTTVLLVDGDETGWYWTFEECEAGRE